MTNDEQKGRADAARGKYAPPCDLSSAANRSDAARRNEEYRQGHFVKRCEMEQERRTHRDLRPERGVRSYYHRLERALLLQIQAVDQILDSPRARHAHSSGETAPVAK